MNEEIKELIKNIGFPEDDFSEDDLYIKLENSKLKIIIIGVNILLYVYYGEILPSDESIRWWYIKTLQFAKNEKGLSDFEKYLLLSICRGSFLVDSDEKQSYDRVIG